jgi:SH3-like domain-containing protein
MQKHFIIFMVFMGIYVQAFGEKMAVIYSGAEIRNKPSAMSSKVLVRPQVYYPVEVLEKGKEYFKIKNYQKLTGYIHKSLLKSQPAVIVTADKANVRSGPDTSQNVAFQLSQGETARLISGNDGWVEIETAVGQKGWIVEFLVWGD